MLINHIENKKVIKLHNIIFIYLIKKHQMYLYTPIEQSTEKTKVLFRLLTYQVVLVQIINMIVKNPNVCPYHMGGLLHILKMVFMFCRNL